MDRLSAWLDSFPLKAAALAPWLPDSVPPAARKRARCAHIHCLRSGVATFGDGTDSRQVQGPAFVFVPGSSRHRCADADLGRVLSATVRFGTSADASALGTMPALVVLTAGADTPLAAACQRIFDETHAGPDGLRAVVDRLFELAVLAALRRCIDERLASTGVLAGLGDARLAEALRVIHERPDLDWSLAALAARCGMSRARFAARFKSVVDTTPGAHVTACRVEKTKQLLREGLEPKQIAGLVGYSDAGALSRAFVRSVGITPSRWLAERSARTVAD